MRAWHWIALVVCGGMTAVAVWRTRQLEPAQEGVQPMAIVPQTNSEEAVALREQTIELAGLRNEVMRLRSKKAELDSARRENVQLHKAEQTGEPIPHESPAGFVSKEKLSNAGFATPDDAVQTFFWAVREANLEMLVQSLTPDNRERQRVEKLSPEKRAAMAREIHGRKGKEEMEHFTDLGVRSREMISDDVVALHVGSSLTTNTMRIQFQRTSEGWKLKDLF